MCKENCSAAEPPDPELRNDAVGTLNAGSLSPSLIVHLSFSQVNLFFLLNIVRVLITKLKVTHQAESSLYMKAVRATLILVPLLGIQFVLLPYKPEGHVSYEIFNYMMAILMHYQVRTAGKQKCGLPS